MIAASSTDEVRQALDAAPLSRGQFLAIALVVLMAVVDGYDLLAMSLVAPVVSHEWGMGKGVLGLVLAAGLAGMAAGSLLISPFADILGRKPVLVTGLALTAVGTIASAASHSALTLGICRGVTGLGIGAMAPLLATVAAELANARRRGLVVTISTLGQPIGGIIGGLTAAAVLRHQSWTFIFLFGGIGTTLLIPIVALSLPESTSFLASRRPPGALTRLNAVLARFGQPPLSRLPSHETAGQTSYRALFAPGLAATTLRLTVINVLVVMAAYYLISWLPQLIADAGFAASTAGLVSVVVSLIGIPGGLLLGALSAEAGAARLAAGAMIGLGIALACLGFAPPVMPIILGCAAACGFFLSGCTGAFYAAVADSFTPLSRASGIGFVMGVGRIFSALGPLIAGQMFQFGANRGEVSLLFAAGAVLAGIFFGVSAGRSRTGKAELAT